MSDVWDARAAAYVESDAHREGDDLEQLVAWAGGARTALDVATGGGHVARRLREQGLEVVTLDPSPGMSPDVIARAEELPFADGSFDVVACRTAAHHFADPAAAVAEMARVSAGRVLLVDTEFMGEQVEQAEALRDPSHVRNYTESEWRGFAESAGLHIEIVDHFEHSFDLAAWLARTGCSGETAERAVALLGERVQGGRLTLRKIALRAVKA
ncbi:MAG TPA: class I SAM-dependent methyltransferase [Gaiellaceae bacterium]|nr:class I SAM-dependent methyltransferase [Gaiellaceae bacterium]